MIKRLQFVGSSSGLGDRGDVERLRAVLEAGARADRSQRPLRVTLCQALDEVIPGQRHEAIGIEWFEDAGHLGRFERWSATEQMDAHQLFDPVTSPLVVAEESVLRGPEWLERHWADRGEAYKHMAVARRADGLTPQAFSERWRSRAGTVVAPGTGAATTIPDEAKGCAYVQNHPLVRAGGWAYDAINEVYFESIDGLGRRIAWFDEMLGSGTEDDLVAEHCFLAVAETVLTPG